MYTLYWTDYNREMRHTYETKEEALFEFDERVDFGWEYVKLTDQNNNLIKSVRSLEDLW